MLLMPAFHFIKKAFFIPVLSSFSRHTTFLAPANYDVVETSSLQHLDSRHVLVGNLRHLLVPDPIKIAKQNSKSTSQIQICAILKNKRGEGWYHLRDVVSFEGCGII